MTKAYRRRPPAISHPRGYDEDARVKVKARVTDLPIDLLDSPRATGLPGRRLRHLYEPGHPGGRLVMTAVDDNSHLGTPVSVQKLVNLVFGHAVVEECVAGSGGHPYRFRIRTTDPVNQSGPHRRAYNRAILATKPASRWPEPVARIRNVGDDLLLRRSGRFSGCGYGE